MTDSNIPRAIAFLTVACLLCIPFMFTADASAEETDGWILIDDGNGSTEWISSADVSGMTVGDVLESALTSLGRTYSYDLMLSIDGISSTTIGGAYTTGSMDSSGLTGVTVTSTWNYYVWSDGWIETVYDPAAAYSEETFAIGFYPASTAPSETPEHMSSWTTVRGDAALSGAQTSIISEETGKVEFIYESRANSDYVCSSILVHGRYVYVGFGGTYNTSVIPTYFCYDRFTGAEIWSFEYGRGAGYETASGCIVGEYLYIPATEGRIYRIPLEWDGIDDTLIEHVDIPDSTPQSLTGSTYASGPASLVYDSGVIYCGASNGMVYCFDLDLNLIWSYQTGGCIYYTAPNVTGGHVYIGALNGALHIIDKTDGREIVNSTIYTTTSSKGVVSGLVSAIVVIDDTLIFSFSDGLGMNTKTGGVGVYKFNGTSIIKHEENTGVGLVPTYHLPVVNDDFEGTVFFTSKGMYKIGVDGTLTSLGSPTDDVKAAPVLVNGDTIYVTEYKMRGKTYQLDLDGNILYTFPTPLDVLSYCMTSVVVIDGWTYHANDGGFYAVDGQMNVYVASAPPGDSGWFDEYRLVIILIVVLALLVALYFIIKYVMRKRGVPPGSFRAKAANALKLGQDEPHVKRSRRKLRLVLLIGIVISVILFMVCLMYGRDGGSYSVAEAFGLLISAIQKGGEGMTNGEIIIFSSRFPRVLAAFMVGVGLSVAGAVYQAIIRNPLVDPYIMGVSSGAGTAAVAVIAFNFTFFGLFSVNSIYLTAIAALVGGLIAFFATMLIAEKAGGSSVNYVLAGVVVGLAFSAVQTLMLSMAGHRVSNALAWLFGSFANVSWTNIWMIVIPALALSLIPLFWAKEFNLVLLGEDEARQMGLDVRRFNRLMLILASILTAFCVAFVGIIGFVGLVIPHLCRMILGGDHRLVLPASMVLGGALMMFADFASRMILISQELPVGAITTIIGVPVFAYLLIKRGRMYDG